MENWQKTRNYRRMKDENGNVIANVITVFGEKSRFWTNCSPRMLIWTRTNGTSWRKRRAAEVDRSGVL